MVRVYATGSNRGAAFFTEGGDVDTGAALLTLDDGTLALVSSTRYNGGGHDVRLEVMGELGSVGVGLDDSLALRSAEPGATFPRGPQHHSFMERFLPAYRAELTCVHRGGGRLCEQPVHRRRRTRGLPCRRGLRAVACREPAGRPHRDQGSLTP